MNNLKLDNPLSLGIESYARGLQLMVFDRDELWVCRKVRVKVFKDFLKAEQGHLFKGRLQLDKSGDNIAVVIKGSVMGMINTDELKRLLSLNQLPISI